MKAMNHTSPKPGRLETTIYIGLWLLAFMLFLLDIMRVRYASNQSLLDRTSVWHVCYNMLPFLILFAVNNYLLIPRFLKRDHYLTYILTAALTIGIVWLGQCGQFISFIQHYGNGSRPLPHHDGPRPLLPLPLFLDLIYDILIVGVNLAISMIFQNFRARLEQEQLMKEKVENQLTYLKAQINPHFYMNMLNNIHGMIEIDPDKAQNLVIEMSRLMRYMLYDSSKPGIGLSSEVRFIKDYLGIMRVRYPEDTVRFSVRLPDESETRGILVPPLIFLVFIENAFKHGISYSGSFVSVSLSVKDGRVNFCFMNSVHKADGKPTATNPEKEKKSGIGLRNVRRRLDIIYGDRYTLDIQPRENVYTVNLTIPPYEAENTRDRR